MTYEEESYILDALMEMQEFIRSPEYRLLIRETHENNIMLKLIIKVLNTYLSQHNQENSNDFDRNVLANIVSLIFDINRLLKKR